MPNKTLTKSEEVRHLSEDWMNEVASIMLPDAKEYQKTTFKMLLKKTMDEQGEITEEDTNWSLGNLYKKFDHPQIMIDSRIKQRLNYLANRGYGKQSTFSHIDEGIPFGSIFDVRKIDMFPSFGKILQYVHYDTYEIFGNTTINLETFREYYNGKFVYATYLLLATILKKRKTLSKPYVWLLDRRRSTFLKITDDDLKKIRNFLRLEEGLKYRGLLRPLRINSSDEMDDPKYTINKIELNKRYKRIYENSYN